MINWKNFDSLASYKEIADVERVNLAEAMTGANGAERVKIQCSYGSRHGL